MLGMTEHDTIGTAHQVRYSPGFSQNQGAVIHFQKPRLRALTRSESGPIPPFEAEPPMLAPFSVSTFHIGLPKPSVVLRWNVGIRRRPKRSHGQTKD